MLGMPALPWQVPREDPTTQEERRQGPLVRVGTADGQGRWRWEGLFSRTQERNWALYQIASEMSIKFNECSLKSSLASIAW